MSRQGGLCQGRALRKEVFRLASNLQLVVCSLNFEKFCHPERSDQRERSRRIFELFFCCAVGRCEVPSTCFRSLRMTGRGNGLPRQSEDWLAMTDWTTGAVTNREGSGCSDHHQFQISSLPTRAPRYCKLFLKALFSLSSCGILTRSKLPIFGGDFRWTHISGIWCVFSTGAPIRP